MCFDGYYRNKSKNEDENKNDEDNDVFDMIASALQVGIRYSDLGEMSFVMLSNIIDAMMPKKHKPTQEEINMII